MELNTKTDLLREIEEFSKALFEYRSIEQVLIPQVDYSPYYSEGGHLKRADYSGDILDEKAFLIFYSLFFDKIKLEPDAEKVSDSKYFNTIYHKYRVGHEKKMSKLDPFMQVVRANKEKEDASNKEGAIKSYNAVEEFLTNVLVNETRKKIESKSSSDKSLLEIINKESGKHGDGISLVVIDTGLLAIAAIIASVTGWVLPVQILIISSVLLLMVYILFCVTHYRLSKLEKEELKQLPKNFKKYILGEKPHFNKDFFSNPNTSYMEPFFKGSIVYPYVKAKYTKKESGNGIVNE